MARTPWDNPDAEKTFRDNERGAGTNLLDYVPKTPVYRIKDVERDRENVSGQDNFNERYKGDKHRFEGDTTPEYEESVSGSYPKKRIR